MAINEGDRQMSVMLAEVMSALIEVMRTQDPNEGLTPVNQYIVDALNSLARAQHIVYSDITKQIEAWEGNMTQEGIF